MTIHYDRYENEFFIKEPIDNQTMRMAFSMTDWTDDTIHFNVYLTLYNKRKQIASNEAEAKSTGANPLKTFFVARKAFNSLVDEVLKCYSYRYDVIISCTWLDNRRRDAYYKYLSTQGYQYGRIDGEKCIFKRYKKGTIV